MNIDKATHWWLALGAAFGLALAGTSMALAQEATTSAWQNVASPLDVNPR